MVQSSRIFGYLQLFPGTMVGSAIPSQPAVNEGTARGHNLKYGQPFAIAIGVIKGEIDGRRGRIQIQYLNSAVQYKQTSTEILRLGLPRNDDLPPRSAFNFLGGRA